jgi:hypothetical protein
MKPFLALILALPLLLLPALTSCNQGPDNSGTELKAAIIDQLADVYPNPSITSQVAEILKKHGFTVDIWQGNEVTPDLYASLPEYGYKLILFRAHLGISGEISDTAQKTCLFTGEPYSPNKYRAYQLRDTIMNAHMEQDATNFFAINSRFISDAMEGRFDDTVILMMGCFSYHLDDMAEAFMQKGTSAYAGWDGLVTLEYMDKVTVNFMDNIFTRQLSIDAAVAQTMIDIGHDPIYHSNLKCYPASSHESIASLIH